MNHSTFRTGLLPFLVVSAGIHGSLMLAWPEHRLVTDTRRLGQTELDVQLEERRAWRSPAHSSELPVQTVPLRSNPQIVHTRLAGIRNAPEPAADPLQEAGPASDHRRLQNQLLGELRSRLSNYLTYPPVARARGWEGTVLLGLRVELDGRLEKIRVERGSGYPILDSSALESLNRVARLSGTMMALEGRGIDLLLPIVYQLARN